MDESRPPDERGVSDALRTAIERTLSSLGDAGSASGPNLPAGALGRAGQLLDEVARRGREAGAEIAHRAEGTRSEIAKLGEGARVEIARRGQEARDASFAITSTVLDAVAETLRRRSNSKVEGE